jgi:hypothetical protein
MPLATWSRLFDAFGRAYPVPLSPDAARRPADALDYT